MSQPNTTSQKPKPLSTAEKNLSRWMYLPRSTPSMSDTATFTLPMVDLRIASTMVEASFISGFGFFMSLLSVSALIRNRAAGSDLEVVIERGRELARDLGGVVPAANANRL